MQALTASTRAAVVLVAATAALAVPAVASAHVGKTPPVATDFRARITHPVPGIETTVVDGDQTLWLDAGAHAVTIEGIQSEPLLRFGRRGVWLNLRSLTAQTDQIDRYDLRPDPNPHAPPLWHELSGGHIYEWHDHRLHILEPVARGRSTAATLGTWTIPLLVDGRRTMLAGVLDYQPPPSMLLWIGVTLLLAAGGALAAWRSRRLTIRLALGTIPVVWALRISRELYGRPTVGAVGWLEVALTSLVGLAFLYGLLRAEHEVRVFVAFLAAFGSLYQGLTMHTILTRATALTLLPTDAARVGVLLTFSLGAATLAGTWCVLAERRRPAGDGESLAETVDADGVAGTAPSR